MFPFLPFPSFNLRQDKTRQDKLTLSLDKSQMIPYWCLSLWRWCRQNYPLLFLPKLRQDKTRQDNYTRLKTDWLILCLFDCSIPFLTKMTHEQSRVMQRYPYDDDQDHSDKMPYCDSVSEWHLKMLACLLSSQMLFYDADPTWELSYATSSNTTNFHARAHTRHPTDIKMVPPRIELGS